MTNLGPAKGEAAQPGVAAAHDGEDAAYLVVLDVGDGLHELAPGAAVAALLLVRALVLVQQQHQRLALRRQLVVGGAQGGTDALWVVALLT